MPSYCCVTACKNTKKKEDDLHFFRFPRNKYLKDIWVNRCLISNHENANTGRVCSNHFEQTDFCNWMKCKMMGGKLLLNKNAIPSKNLPTEGESLSLRSTLLESSNVEDTIGSNCLKQENVIVQNKTSDDSSSKDFASDKKDDILHFNKRNDNLDLIELYDEIEEDPEEISGETCANGSNISNRLCKKKKHIPFPQHTKLLLVPAKPLSSKHLDQMFNVTSITKSTIFDNSGKLCERNTNSNMSDVYKETKRESTEDENNSVGLRKKAAAIMNSELLKETKSETTDYSDEIYNDTIELLSETAKTPSIAHTKVLLLKSTPLNPDNSNKSSNETEQLKQQIAMMQKQINLLKKQNNKYVGLKNKYDDNKTKLKLIERQLLQVGNNNQEVIHTEIRKVLAKVFTETQIKILLDKKKRVSWSDEDIARAFAVLYSSKRCYIFLREKLHIPLPGLSTLRRWTQRLHVRKGCLNGVIRLLEIAGSQMSNLDKLVVLQYGKITVAQKYEYDKETDEVIGPYKYMQVVLATSLCGKWKQPIFADFDKRIDATLLNELFAKLHNIGFRVVACVSDSSLLNARLWTLLGINWEKPWIDHPCIEDKKIYFFADAAHMLKQLRNWFLDTGFELVNGAQITKKPLVEFLSDTENSVSKKYGITMKHIQCVGAQRNDLSLAVELLSPAVSCVLPYYDNGDSVVLAEFIDAIHNWFDIMSSSEATLQTKGGYSSSDLDTVQDECLDKVFEMILLMRCISKTKLMKFQEGILFSIKSLQQLFADLSEEFNVNFILTSKLGLGGLENVFSQLREGSDDYPTPLRTLNRLRNVVSGKIDGTNSSERTEHEENIVSKVLDGAGIEIFSSDDEVSELQYSDMPDELTDLSIVNEAQTAEYLRNWARWTAKRLQSTHPHLGVTSYEMKVEDEDHSYYYAPLDVEPSQGFLQELKELDRLFCKYTEHHFVKVKNLSKKIIKYMSDNCKTEKVIIETFVKYRILSKLNYLNTQIEETKLCCGKRKFGIRKRPKSAKKVKLSSNY